MKTSWRRLSSSLVLLCLLLIAPLVCAAQDYGDTDTGGDSGADQFASMSLNFDGQGGVDATLDLSKKPDSMEELQSALAQALHCAGSRFDTPGKAARRYRGQTEKYLPRRVTGGCTAVLARQGGLLEGDFDYSALAAELHRAGADQLTLYINLPKTEFRDYTRTNLVAGPRRSSTFLVYQIALNDNAKPPILHLAYGFRQQDLYRAFAILAGFIFIPLLITMWMRHSALATAKEDAAGAWFGFARSLNVLLTVSMLLWLTSGFGAKQVLHDWIVGRGFDNWLTALSDVTVMVAPVFLTYLVCMAVSYPVHERLRGSQLSYREFLARQIVTIGAQALPLMLGLAAMQLWNDAELAVILLALAFVTYQVLKILKLRVLKSFPQELTTGELRDKVF